MPNPKYIADQLLRIQTEYREYPEAQLDSFRRIASNADILETSEELTPEKALEIQQFCADFVASDVGRQELIEQRAARLQGYRQ